MSSLCLVGPPEIKNPKLSPSLATAQSANTGNPFLDLLNTSFNSIDKPLHPPKTQTENSSPTYYSTGKPCLDFFYHVVPDTPDVTLTDLLQKAYDHSPITAVKLICNLRGNRGAGKSDKEGFYKAALWLHKYHPKTLACNVGVIARFGYFKDLPEILYRILLNSNVRDVARAAHSQNKMLKQQKIKRASDGYGDLKGKTARPFDRKKWSSNGGSSKKKIGESDDAKAASREARVMASRKRDAIEKKEAKRIREEKRISMAKKAITSYAKDPDYRFLFERISDFFAKCLKADLVMLESGKLRDISLAAKWCPSLDSSYDRVTLLCERIGRKMFPREEYEEGLLDAHYAFRVRERLRKQVLVPLRKALLERRKKAVAKEVKESVEGERVKTDKKRGLVKGKVSDGWYPHEIIGGINYGDGRLAESQWKRMVDKLLRKGKLRNCLAVCDVSSGMNGVPMEVSVALAVLVTELSEEPWNRNILTLCSKPQLQKVEGENLRSKIEFVRDMKLGGSSDLQKVFDMILQSAMLGNLKENEMIKRVFVFSDMEFHQETWADNKETDYEAITRKFAEKGYRMPEVVFWNVRSSGATPVVANQPGVTLVSGFSKNLMTLFLEDGGAGMNPEKFMEKVIAGEEYSELVVLD